MKNRIRFLMSFVLVGIMITAADAGISASFGIGSRPRTRAVVVERHELTRHRIRGVVTRVHGQIAYIRTRPGHVVAVRLGPESYWDYYGYALVPGQQVTVSSWYDPDDDAGMYFAGTIWGPGFSIELTNDVGVPVWVEDYHYENGWHPTHSVYDDWYVPTYRYVAPPGHLKGAPPGHVKHASPQKEQRHGRRGHGR